MENEKKTKTMYFEELKNIVAESAAAEADKLDLTEFLNKQIEQIETRKDAAKARAEKKRAESDALTTEIGELLGEEPMTIEDILASLNDEEVTRNKVSARLGKLIKAGVAEKTTVKVDGARKMAYYKADTTTPV